MILLLIQWVYEKHATRAETERASIAASSARVEQGPWSVIGPFDNAGGRGAEGVFPPEREIKLDAEYVGADGQMVRWREGAFKDDDVHSLDLFGRLNYSLCYLARTLEAEKECDVTLFVGSDDSISVWVNGERLHHNVVLRGQPTDKDVVPARLRAGTNTVLLKVANWEGPTNFYYRLERLPAGARAELDRRLEEDFPSSSEAQFYRIETLAVPDGVVLEVGGMCFTVDGVLMICTRRGDVWAVKQATTKPEWSLFASGLHEPLGLCAGEKPGEIYCVQRPELTRIADTDGDGRADAYDCITDAWGLSGHYHEFAFGPVRDREGNFYGTLNVAFHDSAVGDAKAPYRGWAFKVTPAGEFIPWATGLRSPNGIAFNLDGDLFVTDNQGDYIGTGPLHHVAQGDFHGHPAGLPWREGWKGDPFKAPLAELDTLRKPAALLFPFGPMGQSASEPTWDATAGKFGPFAGQMFVGDQTKSSIMRAALEKVGGEYQGACFPFRAGFQSGNNRTAWAPDGSLFVGQTDRGWGAVGGKPWGVQRVVWTDKVPMEIHTMSLTEDGFELTFTKDVDPATARAWSIQHYYYEYHRQYGSPQFGNTPVKARDVRVEGAKVRLVLPELVGGRVYEFHVEGLRATDGSELLHGEAYYTLNRRRGETEY